MRIHSSSQIHRIKNEAATVQWQLHWYSRQSNSSRLAAIREVPEDIKELFSDDEFFLKISYNVQYSKA